MSFVCSQILGKSKLNRQQVIDQIYSVQSIFFNSFFKRSQSSLNEKFVVQDKWTWFTSNNTKCSQKDRFLDGTIKVIAKIESNQMNEAGNFLMRVGDKYETKWVWYLVYVLTSDIFCNHYPLPGFADDYNKSCFQTHCIPRLKRLFNMSLYINKDKMSIFFIRFLYLCIHIFSSILSFR